MIGRQIVTRWKWSGIVVTRRYSYFLSEIFSQWRYNRVTKYQRLPKELLSGTRESVCSMQKIKIFKSIESELSSLEDLRSEIASYLLAPHQNLVQLLNAASTELVGVFNNFSKKN